MIARQRKFFDDLQEPSRRLIKVERINNTAAVNQKVFSFQKSASNKPLRAVMEKWCKRNNDHVQQRQLLMHNYIMFINPISYFK